MRFVSIASGSSGNCIYIGEGDTHILIDAGVSCKRITDGLHQLGIKPSELSCICITHEHSDHVCGLPVFLKKNEIPVYSAGETIERLRTGGPLSELSKDRFHKVEPDSPFLVGNMTIYPIATSHDAVRPLSYRVDCEGKSAAVMTDLGYYSPYIVERMQNLDAILLEANHDLHMLEVGPYPYYLKQRIMGEKGHLSNECAGRLLNEILHDNMKYIMLGHISKENNYEELAYETVRLEINMGDGDFKADDFPISVAKRDVLSEEIDI